MSNKLHEGHRGRMKERFYTEGIDAFDNHQLLELMLFYVYPQRDTNELAHKYINEFGGFENLFDATAQEIQARCGVTLNVATYISLISHIAKRYIHSRANTDLRVNKDLFKSVNSAGNYIKTIFLDKVDEEFYIICLNAQRRHIRNIQMAAGSISGIDVSPRRVVEEAIKFRASGIILAHNHPSGELKPSKADVETTITIRNALEVVEIELLDHFIVSGDKFYSFTANKRISSLYEN